MRQTSKEAYQEVIESGLLGKLQLKVYETLYYHGPLTGAQVKQQLSTQGLDSKTSETIRNRITELNNLKVVAPYKIDKCLITNRRVIYWQTTNHIPKEKPKIIRKKDKKTKLLNGIDIFKELINDKDFPIKRKWLIMNLNKIANKIQEI